jgi:hypothetical protein
MEQDKVTFGTGGVDIDHKEMKYGTEQGHFFGTGEIDSWL